jgi:hypothetical protein
MRKSQTAINGFKKGCEEFWEGEDEVFYTVGLFTVGILSLCVNIFLVYGIISSVQWVVS